ncbi:MAG: response regulator [Nanoarchaeota archaeon]|nr:response regulator [Nanoarchaeota archaeon]MBU4124164.1 response regulator [Nanoarchaeota archaeon]
MKKILIVDNDKTTVDTISKMILTSEEYGVIKTIGAKQVISEIKKTKPDLFMIDIMMPGIDGITLSERLYNNKSTKNIPILIFSALNMEAIISESQIRKRLPNIKGFLEKPFTIRVLIKKIDSIIK